MEKKNIPPHYLVQLGILNENFQSEAAKFAHIMTHGGGILNMGMADTLRKLNYLYMQVAAHVDAARDIDKKSNLESGVKALEQLRELEAAEDQKLASASS